MLESKFNVVKLLLCLMSTLASFRSVPFLSLYVDDKTRKVIGEEGTARLHELVLRRRAMEEKIKLSRHDLM